MVRGRFLTAIDVWRPVLIYSQVRRRVQQHRRDERGRGRRLSGGGHVRGVRGRGGHFVGRANGRGQRRHRHRHRAAAIRHGDHQQQLRGRQHYASGVQHDVLDDRGHVHVRRRHGGIVGGGRRARRTGQLDSRRIRFHGCRFFRSVSFL